MTEQQQADMWTALWEDHEKREDYLFTLRGDELVKEYNRVFNNKEAQ